ncbi:hypothetical protein [Hymenobacter norwichensis]|uniref:hypothetical protein n=1 Tax=Hymenobacter norwichensis TaxID=223903 RepID=UPI0003B3A82A|nr:hypothetical protein [Hymenobacter norwichensis]
MKTLLFAVLLGALAFVGFAQDSPPVAIAKTMAGRKAPRRALMLEDGVKRYSKFNLYATRKGNRAREFENEGAVLALLDSLGWVATPNGQEQTPYGEYNLYMLKRKPVVQN